MDPRVEIQTAGLFLSCYHDSVNSDEEKERSVLPHTKEVKCP